MQSIVRNLSFVFTAGALGGLANSAALWGAGGVGLTGALGVAIAPSLTAAWLYPRLVWGALWGLVFLLPFSRERWVARGLVASLAPSLVQLFGVFPWQLNMSMLGLELGALTPVVVLAVNAVWGVATSWWLRIAGR
ncbi:MAG: hypothetical protein V3S87_08950 [Alphaproteobacteria bacterium]